MSVTKKRVCLIEDHPLLRKGIKTLIDGSESYIVVGEMDSIRDATEWVKNNSADIFVLDLSLKDGFGLEAIPIIKKFIPTSSIVILTMHKERDYLARAIKLGAEGFLLKDMAAEKLIEVLDSVTRRQTCFFGSETLQPEYLSLKGPLGNINLSKREREVAELLKEGKSLTAISEELNLSVKTVFTYKTRIRHKLEHTSSELDPLKQALK